MVSPGNTSPSPSFFTGSPPAFRPINLAGFPTAVALGGTSIKTSDPAPILAPSPILMLPKMVAPAPIKTPSPILGWRSPTALPVPPSVTWWRMETLLPMTAVSPITTPVAWSRRMPFPMCAAGWMSTVNTSAMRDWRASASGLRFWVLR